MSKYRFCEPVHASSYSKWHVRRLTKEGTKYTGGADTPALCKHKVDWDLRVAITPQHLSHACPACAAAYAKLKHDEEEVQSRKYVN